MCIICVSPKGIRQPSAEEIRTMFKHNPDSAGYMVARGDSVEIHKGYETAEALLSDLSYEKFTDADVVVYHFRISTQGFNLAMSQPFPVTENTLKLKKLDTRSRYGIAHNGVLGAYSNGDKEYSDTALFIKALVAPQIRKSGITKQFVNLVKEETIGSRICILDADGRFYLTGKWIYEDGLYFSNGTYEKRYYEKTSYTGGYSGYYPYKFSLDDKRETVKA